MKNDPPTGDAGGALAAMGPRINDARTNAGMTREGLAGGLGVTVDTIKAWESGRRTPRANRLQMLAGMLNVSMLWLLDGVEDEAWRSETDDVETLRADLGHARTLLAEASRAVERATRRLSALESGD